MSFQDFQRARQGKLLPACERHHGLSPDEWRVREVHVCAQTGLLQQTIYSTTTGEERVLKDQLPPAFARQMAQLVAELTPVAQKQKDNPDDREVFSIMRKAGKF